MEGCVLMDVLSCKGSERELEVRIASVPTDSNLALTNIRHERCRYTNPLGAFNVSANTATAKRVKTPTGFGFL
jgi:hypothetical protein